MIKSQLLSMNGVLCSCGKVHSFSSLTISGEGALKNLTKEIERLGGKLPYVISDANTKKIAEGKVKDELLSLLGEIKAAYEVEK